MSPSRILQSAGHISSLFLDRFWKWHTKRLPNARPVFAHCALQETVSKQLLGRLHSPFLKAGKLSQMIVMVLARSESQIRGTPKFLSHHSSTY